MAPDVPTPGRALLAELRATAAEYRAEAERAHQALKALRGKARDSLVEIVVELDGRLSSIEFDPSLGSGSVSRLNVSVETVYAEALAAAGREAARNLPAALGGLDAPLHAEGEPDRGETEWVDVAPLPPAPPAFDVSQYPNFTFAYPPEVDPFAVARAQVEAEVRAAQLARPQVEAVRATAEGRHLTIEVDGTGVVNRVRFSPSAFTERPTVLSAEVLSVYNEARATAREQVAAVLASVGLTASFDGLEGDSPR